MLTQNVNIIFGQCLSIGKFQTKGRKIRVIVRDFKPFFRHEQWYSNERMRDSREKTSRIKDP